MIKIKRGPAPKFLKSTKVKSANEHLKGSSENMLRQERFRFDASVLEEVRPDLMKMCQAKCAYCETSVGAIGIAEIEHYRPTSGARGMGKEYAPNHYWWLAYEWDNLLMVCQICLKHKRDFFPLENETNRAAIGATGSDLKNENPLLIDPCSEDPSEHISFDANGILEGKTKKGKTTIDILGLNRRDIVMERYKAAERFHYDLQNLKNQASSPKGFLDYISELHSDYPKQQYAGTLRTVFAAWLKDNSELWNSLTQKSAPSISKISKQANKANKTNAQSYITDFEKHELNNQISQIKRFSIKSIEIENFKSIDKLSIQILPTGNLESRESWLLLLGDNGIGKSSILQAITLALAGKKQLDLMNLDVLDFLRYHTPSGFVKIHSYEQDEPIVLHFDPTGFQTDIIDPPTFLLAYGSTRLLPKGTVECNNNMLEYVNINNLFDYTVALCDPHMWLSELDDKEFNDRVAPAFFDVLALRGDDRLYLENGRINIAQFGTSNPLEDNSDGYKTVVALVADIMKTLSVDMAGYHNSQGIVLIDEIGTHLHPRWRMKIVSSLRRAFPNLQFIVTTHEPLCLRGLAHGEVVVLVRDYEKKIRALDKELLPDHNMMRIEQLLTSDLFGLINVMDEEAEKSYEEYYNLLAKKEETKTEADKKKIREMSNMIAEKEVLGSTPDEQVMYKVINETFAKKIREEGFKTKEELKKETIDEVKSFIKTKNLNWL
jgi:uncharacterized protein (TIGR02646 family)